MASQDSKDLKKPASKVFVKSHPTEPVEIGPLEYRNQIINLAQGVVSNIKYTIRPTTKPQATSSKQPESSKPGHSSKQPESSKQGHSSKQSELPKSGHSFKHQSPKQIDANQKPKYQSPRHINPSQNSKQAPNEKVSNVRRKAQEIVSSIKHTIHPTAKPLTPSEIANDAILGTDGTSEVECDVLRGPGKQLDVKLSDRMEYLARPKKGVLYQDGFECPDWAIPEKYLPSWKFLPLHNKIPADRFPYEINMAKVPDEVS